jgi:hypothetical protein
MEDTLFCETEICASMRDYWNFRKLRSQFHYDNGIEAASAPIRGVPLLSQFGGYLMLNY